MAEPIVVVATAACTPLGRSAAASAAAVRAGISGFTEHPLAIDSVGEPVRAAIATWLDIDLTGTDRLQALLFPAIDEALAALQTASASAQVQGRRALATAIALALPAQRPGLADNLQSSLKARLAQRYGTQLAAAACFATGHAAGLLALHAAVGKLRQGSVQACLVAGVDSYIEPRTLQWLEEQDQLHGAGPLNNAWGFIPGEGAGALLLVREATARELKLPVLAHLPGVGLARESQLIKTGSVCLGHGLTQAFEQALALLPEGQVVSDVYCDMNGEPYRGDEFGFTAARQRQRFVDVSQFQAPADCWGDMGAAGSVLHLMLAVSAARKGYAQGPLALIWASSESGERAAALLAAATPGS